MVKYAKQVRWFSYLVIVISILVIRNGFCCGNATSGLVESSRKNIMSKNEDIFNFH